MCVSRSIMSDSLLTPWTVACQDSLSLEFSRQEYWSGLHFLFQRNFLTQGLNPGLLHQSQILYCLSYRVVLTVFGMGLPTPW